MALSPNKRTRIKERDGNRCIVCNSREQLTIDHIIPLSEGGTNADDNLRTLCAPCNIGKANKPANHKAWFNFLFSRKTIYEFKNEIRHEMAAKDGLIVDQTKQLVQAQQEKIDGLLKSITEREVVHAKRIHELAERIRAMQSYHKLEWHEQVFKGYRKIKAINQ